MGLTIFTVASSGGDYTTVQDAVAAIPDNPPVGDDYTIRVTEAFNAQSTTLDLSVPNANGVALILEGAFTVRPNAFSRAEADACARIVVSSGVAIANPSGWLIQGLAIETTDAASFTFNDIGNAVFKRCIIINAANWIAVSGGNTTFENTCLVSGGNGIMGLGQTKTLWNCSLLYAGGFSGFWNNGGAFDCQNVAVQGNGTDFNGAGNTNCLSSDASATAYPSESGVFTDDAVATFDLKATFADGDFPGGDAAAFDPDLATDMEDNPRDATPDVGASQPFVNDPPDFTYGSPQNHTAGDPVSISPTNSGGASTTWTLDSGSFPTGLSIDRTTGDITGTIDPAAVGTFTSTVKAVNSAGSDTFEIEWDIAEAAPIISYESGKLWLFAGHGKTTTFLPANTGGDCDDFSSIGTAFPAGVSLDPTTGLITVGPTAALGTTAGLQVRGTNSGGDGDSQIMTLVVLPHLPTGGYSFAPDERIDTSQRLGIDAWDPDLGEVRRVEVSINGGASFNITARTLDTGTGVWDFGFTLLAALYADGPVTIDATIVPYDGDSRVLPQITVHANSGGTLTPALKTRYCSTTGNDANSGVSPALACLTPGKAAERIQLAFGDCGNGTVICAAGDYGFIEGATIALTTNTGKLEFKPAPGATVRWTDGSFGNQGATRIKTTDIAVFQTDLLATAANGAYLHLNGNTVCTGLGQIDASVTFAGTGNWTGGIYVTGYAVDWAAIGRGDTAAYRLAAETKYVIFEESAGFPFDTTLKQNWWARVTSKDCGVSFDNVVQNMIDDSIDATGSLFHADVVHLFDSGGDINVLVHGGVCSECAAQSFFSRNGAVSADNPDCNVAFVNVCIRKPDATNWNGQWIRSTSNICWDFCALPNQAQLIDDDVGTPIENHMQGTRIRGTVFAGITFTTIGEKYVVDLNHFMSGTFGTNCTTGGTETTLWTDPANDDYSVVVGSAIEDANTTLRTGLNHDALGRQRYEGGSIGPFTSEADVPPDPPAEASSDGYLRSFVPWGTPHWRTPTRR